MVVVSDTALYRDERIPGDLPSKPDLGRSFSVQSEAIFTTDVLSFYFDNAPGWAKQWALGVGNAINHARARLVRGIRKASDSHRARYLAGRIPGWQAADRKSRDKGEDGAGFSSQTRWKTEPVTRAGLPIPRNFTRALSRFLRRHERAMDRCHSRRETATVSCPDCLRSLLKTGFSHGLLDWRLALDLAELTLALPLGTGRWIDGAEFRIARAFAAFCTKIPAGSWCRTARGPNGDSQGRAGIGPLGTRFGIPRWAWFQPVQLDAQDSFPRSPWHGF